ncbi:MAG: RNA polymerase sigma factor [Bacteroidales bacterium]|jgi:RNA polymerase sigma-70 factor (ECF subfamily)|nr:RNA polymerase sigma factor [Bacteroidales bacterium]
MTSEDSEIIEGCKKQKPMSQKALYEKYSAKMFAVCLRYSRNKADAEDIFQDAFIKVFNVIKQFNFVGSFEGWLRRIFVNYALNYYRSGKKYLNIDDDETIGSETAVVWARFTREEILSAVNALPDNQRLVFNLVEIEGFSYDEVSVQMEIPNATARVLNFRAKALLKKALLDKENFNL